MGRTCVVSACKSDTRKNQPGIKFFSFPKPWIDPERTKKWLNIIGRMDLSPEKVTRNMYICNRHFPRGLKCYDWKKNSDLQPSPNLLVMGDVFDCNTEKDQDDSMDEEQGK